MRYIKISVLLLVISLIQSLAMTSDELQDFSNFLKETSLLDQPLKKNPSYDDDDDVPISDHAWEESGRFEGDLILNDRQRHLIVQDIAEGLSRNGLKDSTKRWPNNEVIFYIQKEHFTGDQVQAILSGIEELSQASCVKFRPYRKGDRDAVVVQGSRRGCFSQVGYQGGYQVLNLSGRHPVGRGCFRHGTVVHEFLHTLGFYHMQSSPDRDDYIDVLWENIVQPARHNFRKYNLFSVSDFGVGYDYDSVLHYSRKAFSSNGGDTLVPKQSGAQIGQRVGLSNKDSAKLNKMYCDADSNNFEAADDVPHAPVIKKKKTPKNKPFEGHGIGYHQGKTVVFKLPAAETFRLPDTPSNHVFDYFSKTPQAMSPTLIEGFGVGKKITYSYKLPATYSLIEHGLPKHVYPALFNRTTNAVDALPSKDNNQDTNDPTKPPNENVGDKTKETLEDLDEESHVDKTKNTQTTNKNIYTDVYKPNTDYSEFYNPANSFEIGTKTNYYINYKPESKLKDDHTKDQMPNLKLTKQFIEKLRQPKITNLSTQSSNKNKEREPFYYNEFEAERDTEDKSKVTPNKEITIEDGSLTTNKAYPYKKLEEIKNIYLLKPEYISKKYLENKDDFSSLYNPSDRHSVSRNAKYTLFGDPVPLRESYTPNITDNIHTATLDSQGSRKESGEENERAAIHPNNNPDPDYNDYHNAEKEYSYEDFASRELTEKPNKPTQYIFNEEDASKSYEVTEKNVENMSVATEKPGVGVFESHETEHNLDSHLPEILASYVSYDNYDITSPCIVSHFKIRC